MRSFEHLRLFALVAVALLFVSDAMACPVCFAAKNESRIAYYVTTGLLLSLPLLMTGGFVWWYRRRAKMLEVKSCSRQIDQS